MIERLYVHNFRCLENFTLDFNGQRSALLIGKNGAGKSTVRSALSVLQAICRGPNRARDVIHAKDFAKFNTTSPMRFEVDILIGDVRYQYAVSFDWPADFHEARILEESLIRGDVMIFSRQLSQVSLHGGAAFGLDWHVFALPVINEKPSERAIRDVKAFFASMYLVAPMPSMMLGFSENLDTELTESASNFSACLRTLLQSKPKAYKFFDTYVKNVMPDFSSIENAEHGKEGGARLFVTFEQSPQSISLDFDLLSTGEKCFLLAAYVVSANAVRSPSDPPVICFWDEPDNHLSISEVGHFITDLRKMATHTGQFIATSHHPETIRNFSDENTYVLTRRSHLDPTVVKRLCDYSHTGDLINALIRDEIIG